MRDRDIPLGQSTRQGKNVSQISASQAIGGLAVLFLFLGFVGAGLFRIGEYLYHHVFH